MNYWQVATGEGTRDFSDVFLQYGVILMGTGRPGSFLEHPERYRPYRGKKDWQRKIVTLADEMKRGDVVVIKRRWGKSGQIVAAGRITSDYEFYEPFNDVDGWDQRHGRKVEWHKPDSPIAIEGLARGTVSKVHKSQIRREADRLLKEEGNEVIASAIPQPARGVSEEDLVGSMIGNGLRPADAEAVIRAIWHVRRLAGWYVSRMDEINEHEIRTFLIIPILLALGWSEQRIKTEWNHTDISLFREVFKKDSKPFLILESKRMGVGLEQAERQVQFYAKQFPDCDRLVTSTGDRYWLYEKNPGETWDARGMKESHLRAYMNLFILKDRHPYLAGVGGAPDLLKSLMPG